MGWIYSHRPKNQSVADWLRAELPNTHASAERVAFVGNVAHLVCAVDAAKVDSEYLKSVYQPCADGKYRQLVVILIGHDRKSHHNTGYKDMTETMGPYESVCPISLLDMLSPLNDGNESARSARDYRERCRAHHARKAKIKAMTPGATIKLETPLTFRDGYTGDTFKIERLRVGRNRRESMVFRAADTGKLYSITNFSKREWHLV